MCSVVGSARNLARSGADIAHFRMLFGIGVTSSLATGASSGRALSIQSLASKKPETLETQLPVPMRVLGLRGQKQVAPNCGLILPSRPKVTM
jgi:hypothetical protein